MSTGTTAQSLVTQLAELMKKSESELERLGREISKKDKQISDLEGKLETAKAERTDLAAQADLLKSAIPASVLPDAAGETQQAAPAVTEETASEAPAAVETEEQAASGDDAASAVGENAGPTATDGQGLEDDAEAATAPAPEAKTSGKATRRKPRKTASTVKTASAESEKAEPTEAVEADAEPAPAEEQSESAAAATSPVEQKQDAEPAAGGQQAYPDPWDDVDSGDAAVDDGEQGAKMVFSPVSFADDDEDDGCL